MLLHEYMVYGKRSAHTIKESTIVTIVASVMGFHDQIDG